MDKSSFFASLKKAPQYVMTVGDVEIYAKQMTVLQRDIYEQKAYGKTLESVRAYFIIACAVDKTGKPLFDDADVQSLCDMPIEIGQALFDAIVKLNPLTQEDMDELKKS